jgi:hypothetical protein
MRSRFPRHLRHLMLALVLLGTAGAVAGITGLPLATSACGCEAKKGPEFLLTGRSTDEFDTKADVTTPLKLEATGSPTIECGKERIEKGVVTNESAEATIKAFFWEECKDTSETKCTVPTIKTNELTDTLQEDGEDAKGEKETDEKFKPKSGEEIANFKLEGSECKEKEKTLRIEGDFISKKEDNDVSEEEHNLGVEVKPENEELKYGDQPVFALFRISLRWALVIPIFWVLF